MTGCWFESAVALVGFSILGAKEITPTGLNTGGSSLERLPYLIPDHQATSPYPEERERDAKTLNNHIAGMQEIVSSDPLNAVNEILSQALFIFRLLLLNRNWH